MLFQQKILFFFFNRSSHSLLYITFLTVTLLHIYANLRAVKSCCLRTFNESRILIALEEFFRNGKLLPVKDVNKLERLIIGKTVSVSLNIKIGMSVEMLLREYRSVNDIETILSSFDPNERFFIAELKNCLGIFLDYDARPVDVLKGYFFAVSYLQDRSQLRNRPWDVQNKWNDFLILSQNQGEQFFLWFYYIC